MPRSEPTRTSVWLITLSARAPRSGVPAPFMVRVARFVTRCFEARLCQEPAPKNRATKNQATTNVQPILHSRQGITIGDIQTTENNTKPKQLTCIQAYNLAKDLYQNALKPLLVELPLGRRMLAGRPETGKPPAKLEASGRCHKSRHSSF